MKVHFKLDKNSIYLRCFPMPYSECKFYIGQSVISSNWSIKKQTVLSKDSKADKINKYLQSIENFVSDTVMNRKIEGYPINGKELESLLIEKYRTTTQNKSQLWSSFMDYFVDSKKSISPNTLAIYKTVLKNPLKYYPELRFSDINIIWKHEYENKLLSDGYKPNYIKKIFVCMSDYISLAVDCNLTDISVHKTKKWGIRGEAVNNDFCTRDEIDIMYNFDYKNSSIRNAVNFFVLGCETGQRVSDYSRIHKGMIYTHNNVEMIRLTTQKSGNRKVNVSIPTNHRILHILDELQPMRIKQIRYWLKMAVKMCGLDYKNINTHTARRSYATNNVIDGVPNSLTMKICGWTTESQFLKYVKINDVMAAVEMSKIQKRG